MSLPSALRSAMALSLLACSPAIAQSNTSLPGFELERLDTNVGRGTLLLGNGELMKQGGLSVTLLGHYQRLPMVLSDGVQDLRVVQDRATGQLSASYGLLPWLELAAQVPFVLWQQGDDLEQLAGLSNLSAQGVGTPVLQARLSLLARRYQHPVDLSADLGVGLPVGTGSALAGDAGPRVHARMIVGTVIGGFQPALEAGVLFRPAIPLTTAEGVPASGARAEVRLAAGVSTTGKKLKGELGLRTTLAPRVSMDLLGGVRFPLLVGLEAFVMGGPSLGRAVVGTPQFRVMAGVTFRDEPPPPLVYLDEGANKDLIIEQVKPTTYVEEVQVHATQPWESASLGRAPLSASEMAPLKPLPPYQPGAQEQIVLHGSVPFARGSTAIRGVVPLLDQAALRLLEQARSGVIIIEGHADNEGLQDTTDARTSLQRAQSIRNYLIAQGIPDIQVRIRGLGSSWPLSDKPMSERDHQLNRRADVLVIGPKPREPSTPQAPPP